MSENRRLQGVIFSTYTVLRQLFTTKKPSYRWQPHTMLP